MTHHFRYRLPPAHRRQSYRCRLQLFHSTIYFPLLVPECLLIEPTETESKQTLDRFVEAMASILNEIKTDPDKVKQAPHNQVIGRLDEVKAARELDLAWKPSEVSDKATVNLPEKTVKSVND